jgi:hypothetical protein
VTAEGCVRDPLGDALRRWDDPLQNGPAIRKDFQTATMPDLDGDGVEEQTVYATYKGCAGMGGNCIYLVFLSHRGCPRYAGRFYGALHTVEVVQSTHRGAHDFRVLGQNGCAGRAGEIETFHFDGTTYQERSRVHCSCPDEHPGERRPRQCPP